MKKPNVLAIIPARGGSKRLPGKNIKCLNGKPLIAHSIEYAINSPEINRLILSTDSTEIATVAEKYGAEVMMRPEHLAEDTTKTAPVLLHVVEELKMENYIPDYIVLLQATVPVREPNLMQKALEVLEKRNYDSFFTGFKKSYTMALWSLDNNANATALYDYHKRPRWQDVTENDLLIAEDGGFYAIKYSSFIKCQDFIGEKPYIHLVNKTVDIDTEQDFERAESLLKG